MKASGIGSYAPQWSGGRRHGNKTAAHHHHGSKESVRHHGNNGVGSEGFDQLAMPLHPRRHGNVAAAVSDSAEWSGRAGWTAVNGLAASCQGQGQGQGLGAEDTRLASHIFNPPNRRDDSVHEGLTGGGAPEKGNGVDLGLTPYPHPHHRPFPATMSTPAGQAPTPAASSGERGGWKLGHPRPPLLNPLTDAFSAAINHMYLGRSPNPLLQRYGLSAPIGAEHLRSRASSVASETNHRGPLRADHSLQTPRSANDREIEEINRAAADRSGRTRPGASSQSTPTPRHHHHPHHHHHHHHHHRRRQRPLSAELHPTYHTDLADDTNPAGKPEADPDPALSPSLTPASGRQGSSRRRVYLIRRPRSAPVYGRITPVVSSRPEAGHSARERTFGGPARTKENPQQTRDHEAGCCDSERSWASSRSDVGQPVSSPVAFVETDRQPGGAHGGEDSIRVRPVCVRSGSNVEPHNGVLSRDLQSGTGPEPGESAVEAVSLSRAIPDGAASSQSQNFSNAKDTPFSAVTASDQPASPFRVNSDRLPSSQRSDSEAELDWVERGHKNDVKHKSESSQNLSSQNLISQVSPERTSLAPADRPRFPDHNDHVNFSRTSTPSANKRPPHPTPNAPRSARPAAQSETLISPSTLHRERPDNRQQLLSNLQSSRRAFGSVDSLLDPETASSSKKNKSKKSLLKSWFTPKKGKYNPGSEPIPSIETSPYVSPRDSNNSFNDDADDRFRRLNSTLSSVHNKRNLSFSADDLSSGPRRSLFQTKTETPLDLTISSDVLEAEDAAEMSNASNLLSGACSPDGHDSQGTHDTAHKTSSMESEFKTLSLVSSKVLKGSSSGSYENTSVKVNTNVTRHEVITIQGSSLSSYDKSVMLNDSGFPGELSSTFKATPVMVTERRFSCSSLHRPPSSPGGERSDTPSPLSLVQIDPSGSVKLSQQNRSTEDLELLSKASRIVQAQQRGEQPPGDSSGQEDEPELVVIREYVFAAKKSSLGDNGGQSAREEPAKENAGDWPTSSDAGQPFPSLSSDKVDGEDGIFSPGSAPAVKEDDSGLDSPPVMQESSHPPPPKPKRKGSKSVSPTLGAAVDSDPAHAEDKPEHTITVEAHSKPTLGIKVRPGETEAKLDKSHIPSAPEAFVNKSFAGVDLESPPPSLAAEEKPSEMKDLPGSTLNVALQAETVYAVPDKSHKSSSAPHKDVKAPVVAETQAAVESIIKPSSSTSVAVKPPVVTTQPEEGASKTDQAQAAEGKDEKVEVEVRPRLNKLMDLQTENRDSLAEEEYTRPWDSDFSSLEDDIRSRITAAFPEEKEVSDMEDKDLVGEIGPGGLSSDRDKEPEKTFLGVGADDKESLGPVYADLQLSRDDAKSEKPAPPEKGAPLPTVVAAAPTLRTPTTPRKASHADRPNLPAPPMPPVAKVAHEEPKQGPPRKPSKSEEKSSPPHHRKLKDKFKKVFSHSSEDKKEKAAKNKKAATSLQKEDSKSVSEDSKASDNENLKAEVDDKAVKDEHKTVASPRKEGANETVPPPTGTDKDKSESPQSADDGKAAQASGECGAQAPSEGSELLSVQNFSHEVKLPLSPKEARKLIKQEKKIAAKALKAQQEEARKNTLKAQSDDGSKEPASSEDHKGGPNKALSWIKKKLATKSKKTPRSKRYDINSTGEDDDANAEGADVKSQDRSDANSSSDDSSDSGTSASDSEDGGEEEEEKKPKRKIPFFGGKKNKKKSKEHDSDSDSSTEETKSKFFSWTLGRKKGTDSSDHDDGMSGKNEDSVPGVAGTYKKIPDNLPQNPNLKAKSPEGSEQPELEKSTLPEMRDSPSSSSLTKSKPESGADKPKENVADSLNPGQLVPASASVSQATLSAPPKLFSLDSGEEPVVDKRDLGDYAKLRKDAAAPGFGHKVKKSPRNSGYELARPLFLEEDEDNADRQPTSKDSEPMETPRIMLSADTDDPADLKTAGKENHVAEDVIVPEKAARPIHQVFDSLEKLTRSDTPFKTSTDRGEKTPASGHRETKTLPPTSPLPQRKNLGPPPPVRPKPPPIKIDMDPVDEDRIIPRDAKEDFMGHRLSPKSPKADSKPKFQENGFVEDDHVSGHCGIPGALSADLKESIPPVVDGDAGHAVKPRAEHRSSVDLRIDLRPDESPRHSLDSDDSAGRTYLDRPDFLSTAKKSWHHQDTAAPGDEAEDSKAVGDAKESDPNEDRVPESDSSYTVDDIELDIELESKPSAPSHPRKDTVTGSIPKVTVSDSPGKGAKKPGPIAPKPKVLAKPQGFKVGEETEKLKQAKPKPPVSPKPKSVSSEDSTDASSKSPRGLSSDGESSDSRDKKDHQPPSRSASGGKPVPPKKPSKPTEIEKDKVIKMRFPQVRSPEPKPRTSLIAVKDIKPESTKADADGTARKVPSGEEGSSIEREPTVQTKKIPGLEAVLDSSAESEPAVKAKKIPGLEAVLDSSAESEPAIQTKKIPSLEARRVTSVESEPAILSKTTPSLEAGHDSNAENKPAIQIQGVPGLEVCPDASLALSSDLPSDTLPTEQSTSSWTEGDSHSPNVGDFSLSLEPGVKKTVSLPAVEVGTGGKGGLDEGNPDLAEQGVTPTAQKSEEEGSLTDVTPLSELLKSQHDSLGSVRTSTPLCQSTPVSEAVIPSPPDVEEDTIVTVTSMSTIHGPDSTSKTSRNPADYAEEEIYESIFFEDLKDLRKKPTEAPPVRPEKARKRQKEGAEPAEPATPVDPDFDDDLDNMYDVPPSRREFTLPKENSLQVFSVVDKRGSKTSLRGSISLEPEDSITPYATFQRPLSQQYVKPDPDYMDDENPYMNDDEDVFDEVAKSDASPLAEQVSSAEGTDKGLPKFTIGGEKPVLSVKPEEKSFSTKEVFADEPVNIAILRDIREKAATYESTDSDCSEISTEHSSFSSTSLETEPSVSPRKENEATPEATDKKSEKGGREEDEVDESNDADIAKSVNEIDKLYAALEKEEEEMEKQASAKKMRAAGPSPPTKGRLNRLLSFDEQRVELKPFRTKQEEDDEAAPTQGNQSEKKTPEKSRPEDKAQDEGSDEETITMTRTTVVETSVIKVHKTKPPISPKVAKKGLPPADSKEKKDPASDPDPRLTDAEKAEASTAGDSPSLGTVLPPLSGYNKLLIKAVHRGEEQHVKIRPAESEQGKGEAPGDDDFSQIKLDLPQTTLEEEVLQSSPYARIMKLHPHSAGSDEKGEPGKDAEDSPLDEPQADSCEPRDELSRVSTFLTPKKKDESPLARNDDNKDKEPKGDAPEKATPPKVPKKPPSTLQREDGSPEHTPREEGEDSVKAENDSSPEVVSIKPTKQTKASPAKNKPDKPAPNKKPKPVLSKFFSKKSPSEEEEPRTAKSADDKESPRESPTTKTKPDLPATKPRPKPKPRDLVVAMSNASEDSVDANSEATETAAKPEEVEDGNSEDSAPDSPTSSSEAPTSPESVDVPPQAASKEKPAPYYNADAKDEDHPGPTKEGGEDHEPDGAKGTSDVDNDDSDRDDDDLEEPQYDEHHDSDDSQGEHDPNESPPLPERRYKRKNSKYNECMTDTPQPSSYTPDLIFRDSKYNEYSNVIRIDSQRLVEARARSHSRGTIAEDLKEAKKQKGHKLRNAKSLGDGLDGPAKKPKKSKKEKPPKDKEGGEDGEKKPRKHGTLLKSFKELFGSKRKKKDDKADPESHEDDNVYEVVDDFPEAKPKKEPPASKQQTLPKQQKRKKSEHSLLGAPNLQPPIISVDSSHDTSDIRPIGRLLQLNPDGTQLLELIRPENGHLGVQLTQGNDETVLGKFVSGFVDKSTEKLLSGILGIGDQVLTINDKSVDNCPLIEVHDIIDTNHRLKFLTIPADNH